MFYSIDQLKKIRNRLRVSLQYEPGIESISITKISGGRIALAVHVHEEFLGKVDLPDSFDDLPVILQPASSALLQ